MPWAQCGGTLARVPSSLRGLIFTYTYIHTYVHTYRDRYAKVYIYIYICMHIYCTKICEYVYMGSVSSTRARNPFGRR